MLNMTKDCPEDLAGVRALRVGLSWKTSGGGRKGISGALKRMRGADLDLACVALGGGQPRRICWFDNTDPFNNGSLLHCGDVRKGKGGASDDETIIAELTAMPSMIDRLVFVAWAFKEGVSFRDVEGITFNVYDRASGENIGTSMPVVDTTGNACVMARASRDNRAGLASSDWSLTVVDEMTSADRTTLPDLGRRYAQ